MNLSRIGAKTKKNPDITDFFEGEKVEVKFSAGFIILSVNKVEDGKGNSHNYTITFTVKEFFEILEEMSKFLISSSEEDKYKKIIIEGYLTTQTTLLLKLLLSASEFLDRAKESDTEKEFLKMAIQTGEIL